EEITQVSTVSERRQIWLIFFGGRLQVETVVIRVVEEVALDTPRLVVHLFPLSPGIDIDLHVLGFDLSFTGLHRLRRGSDEPVVALTEEHLLSVGGEIKRANTVEDFFKLALLHVELMQGKSRRSARCRCWRLREEDRIRFARSESYEVSRWNRQRKDSLANTVKIDGNSRRRFFVIRLRGWRLGCGRIPFLLAVSRLVTRRRFRLFIFGNFLFVTLRSQR